MVNIKKINKFVVIALVQLHQYEISMGLEDLTSSYEILSLLVTLSEHHFIYHEGQKSCRKCLEYRRYPTNGSKYSYDLRSLVVHIVEGDILFSESSNGSTY